MNQRDQMQTRIRNCLLAAYGISRIDSNAIDDSDGLEHHFWSLNPSFRGVPAREFNNACAEEVMFPLCGTVSGPATDVGIWSFRNRR